MNLRNLSESEVRKLLAVAGDAKQQPPAVLKALLAFQSFNDFWTELAEPVRIAMVNAMRHGASVTKQKL